MATNGCVRQNLNDSLHSYVCVLQRERVPGHTLQGLLYFNGPFEMIAIQILYQQVGAKTSVMALLLRLIESGQKNQRRQRKIQRTLSGSLALRGYPDLVMTLKESLNHFSLFFLIQ